MGPCRTSRFPRLPRRVGGRRRPAGRHRRARAPDPPGRRRRHPPVPRRTVRRVDLPALLRAAAPAERPRRRRGSPTSTTADRVALVATLRERDHRHRPLRPHRRDAAPRWPSTSATLPGQGHRVGAARAPRRHRAGDGIARFVAEVLPQNRKMLAVFTEAGYDVSAGTSRTASSRSAFDISADRAVARPCALSREHRAEARQHARGPAPGQRRGHRREPARGLDRPASMLDRHRRRPASPARSTPVNPEAHARSSACRPTRASRTSPAQVDLAVIAVPARRRPRRRRRLRARPGSRPCSSSRPGSPRRARRGAPAARAAAPGPGRRHAGGGAELLRAHQQRPRRAPQRLARSGPAADGRARAVRPERGARHRRARLGGPPQPGHLGRSPRPATGSTSPATTSCSTGSTTTTPTPSGSTWSRWATRASSPGSPGSLAPIKPVIVVKSGVSAFGVPPGHRARAPGSAPRRSTRCCARPASSGSRTCTSSSTSPSSSRTSRCPPATGSPSSATPRRSARSPPTPASAGASRSPTGRSSLPTEATAEEFRGARRRVRRRRGRQRADLLHPAPGHR